MTSKWILRFTEITEIVAGWSKDPNRKVGCSIINSDNRIISTGYNGLPADLKDSKEILNDRDRKRMYTVHAEVNAILNAITSVEGATLFVNSFPCNVCAGVIVAAKIKKVVVPKPNLEHKHWGASWKVAQDILESSGKEIVYVKSYTCS